MPTYDYSCCDCGNLYEIEHKLSESPGVCECGGELEKEYLKAPIGRVAGPTGPIFDDRQIKDTHGEHWRRTDGSRTPGGAGRKAFSTAGVSPGRGASTDKLPAGSWGGDA